MLHFRIADGKTAGGASAGGLLLGHAMQCAEAPDQVHSVDADDFVRGKEIRKDSKRYPVLWVVEGGHEHEAVGDVEVGVAGGKALAAKDDGARHGKLDDGPLLAGRGARGLEAGEVFGERD